MFKPEDLDLYPDSLDGLFQALDEWIIKDYARRIAKAGQVTEGAEWQAIRAEAIGLSKKEIQKEVARILRLSEKEIDRIFGEASEVSLRDDTLRFQSAGLNIDRVLNNRALNRILDAAKKQTMGELRNITQTMGFAHSNTFESLTDFYTRTLDFAQLQITSGVTDYRTAIRMAVKALATKGVQHINYESGRKINIASAARMCTLTGIGQMAMQMSDAICDELGMDIVETSAHPGARPSHMVWQGRMFSRSGKSKKYPALEPSTGLGTAGGLCGVNCRHSYYPVPEGATPNYTEEQLRNIDPKPVRFGSNVYTYFEAGQRMRYMERQIRKTKREAIAYEAAGFEEEFTAVSIKLNRQKKDYKKFAKATGIRPRWERTQELGFDHSIAQRAVHRYER